MGDHNTFERGVVIRSQGLMYGFAIRMISENGQRTAVIVNENNEILWTGNISNDGTPFRACMVSVGLCDAEGNTNIDLPDWLEKARMGGALE
jgi:hypothetical protein